MKKKKLDLLRVTLVAMLILSTSLICSAGTPPIPIPDTQNIPEEAPYFVGTAVEANQLKEKINYKPRLAPMAHLHDDAGNTDVSDFPGPLGNNPIVESFHVGTSSYFDDKGRLNSFFRRTDGVYLVARDTEDQSTRGSFICPDGNTFNIVYAFMNDNGNMVIPSNGPAGPHIYEIEREDIGDVSEFQIIRDIDLSEVIEGGENQLMALMPDKKGNIWFVTGGILGIGAGLPVDYTTMGYVSPDGDISTIQLWDQVVENGFAVRKKTAFILTSRALYAFTTDDTEGDIIQLWMEEYESEDQVKPGGFAKGSGCTVTLIGPDYVAITDNAADQVSLLIYDHTAVDQQDRLVCKVPLFEPGNCAVDVSPIGYWNQNGSYSVIIANIYNAPPIAAYPFSEFNIPWLMLPGIPPYYGFAIDGAHNNYNRMGSGLTRVDILPDRQGYEIVWDKDIKSSTVWKLSTQTGLIYGGTQDLELAENGIYVWYISAIDYETGEEVWKVRAGTGGFKNWNYNAFNLSPDGSVMAGCLGGLIRLRDGAPE